jgi:hypothetical protein
MELTFMEEGGKFSQLADAIMTKMRLQDANLGTADLSKANLRGANLQNANLVGTKLNGADLAPAGDAAGSVPTDLTGAFLSGTDFTGAQLHGTILTDAAVPTSNGVFLFSLDARERAELTTWKYGRLMPSKFDKQLKALTARSVAALTEYLQGLDIVLGDNAAITEIAREPDQWEICGASSSVLHEVRLLIGSQAGTHDSRWEGSGAGLLRHVDHGVAAGPR